MWKINARFARGVPDAWYSGDRGDLWIEYKWINKTPRSFTPPLTALQKHWLKKRHDEGRNVSVIVGSPDGAVILPGSTWSKKQTPKNWLTIKETAGWIIAQTASNST